jgi:hypothetical protein
VLGDARQDFRRPPDAKQHKPPQATTEGAGPNRSRNALRDTARSGASMDPSWPGSKT